MLPISLFQRLLLCFSSVFLMTYTVQAQFFLNSSAIAINDSCYQLTAANNWEVGSIWNGELINLEESFEVYVDIYLGCLDETGADGMVFGLQPISTSIGVGGGDIGFGGVTPSLGVEIDTYQNENFADPVVDHIAVVQNGNLNHNSVPGSLAGPVQASATAGNVEDCMYHALRVAWDATTKTLEVYFDCELRLSYSADIVNTVFGGNPLVYWGFTSATGGLNNIHRVCFSYTSFIDELVDQISCPGEEIQLEASGGVSYSWSPSAGLSDIAIPNPIAAPTETTLYTVEIIDGCGVPFYDDVLITVDNDQFELSITTDPADLSELMIGTSFNLNATVEPEGEGGDTYLWSSAFGSTLITPDSQNTTATASSEYMGTETFTLIVNSPEGCQQEASVSVEIIGVQYEIPNIFSPNGDNINDRFGLFALASIDSYSCTVFNRWGKLVFETNNSEQFWDGTYESKVAPADVYIYRITFQVGGLPYEEEGSITLMR